MMPLARKLFGFLPILAMSRQPDSSTSRIWSCSTLRDGADHLLAEAYELEQEEKELAQEIEDIL